MFKVQLVRGLALHYLLFSAKLLKYNKLTFFTIALRAITLKELYSIGLYNYTQLE